MQKLNFFRKGILALLVAATALVACSKDSDTDNLKPNTVTLNGVEKKIIEAGYSLEDEAQGNYTLYLAIGEDEYVMLKLNKNLHMNGSTIHLNKEEDASIPEENHWFVFYQSEEYPDEPIISASGKPALNQFTQGTLTVSGSPESGNINIVLKKGRVVGTNIEDGGDINYKFTINYSGNITEAKGQP